MFLILLFKLLTQFSFVSFLSISILSCSLSQSSLFSLSTSFAEGIDGLSGLDRWTCPPKIKTSIYYILFTNGTFLYTVSHHDIIFFLIMHSMSLKKTKSLWLSSNLSYPEDLKKQWLPFSILSLLPFLISPSLSSTPSCNSLSS